MAASQNISSVPAVVLCQVFTVVTGPMLPNQGRACVKNSAKGKLNIHPKRGAAGHWVLEMDFESPPLIRAHLRTRCNSKFPYGHCSTKLIPPVQQDDTSSHMKDGDKNYLEF